MKAYSPQGYPIRGTVEVTPGTAQVVKDSFRRAPDGSIEFEHDGYTEMWWDEQKTITEAGEILFEDTEGNQCRESKLVLCDDDSEGEA